VWMMAVSKCQGSARAVPGQCQGSNPKDIIELLFLHFRLTITFLWNEHKVTFSRISTASFGRLTASAFTGILDSTQALVNVNFDFSLVKLEAPEEFRALSTTLTPLRKDTAEQGSLHKTARKLGAIFETLLPATPLLLQKYGSRASEIGVKAARSHHPNTGLFREHIGVDASSIWAAATSGLGAIQCHLLACILARIWKSSEAVSIWVEILEGRKLQIQAQLERSGRVELNTMMAVQQQIGRMELAEWDSSARSWLQVADQVKCLQQKQFELIVGDLQKNVNNNNLVYDSVINTWITSLEGIERLLQGSPMQMQSGELLLGLSAWHLYPDINLLAPATAMIRQNDNLVPKSGILTIGLQSDEASTSKGLRWSLPLAHLRYYGDPVRCMSSIDAEGSRLSLVEFRQALLGCVIGGWNVPDGAVETTINWLSVLSQTVSEDATQAGFDDNRSWLTILGRTAREFLDSRDLHRCLYSKLVYLGRRHASFIGAPNLPYFGLTETKLILRLVRGQEAKIRALRAVALGAKLESDGTGEEEYTTALEQKREPPKRTHFDSTKTGSGHIRWILHTINKNKGTNLRNGSLVREYADQEAADKPVTFTPDDFVISPVEPQPEPKQHPYHSLGEEVRDADTEGLLTIEKEGSPARIVRGSENFNDHLQVSFEPWQHGQMKHYELWTGNFHSAALFIRMDIAIPQIPELVEFSRLESLFSENMLDREIFLTEFLQSIQLLDAGYLNALKAISTMNEIYCDATTATVDIRVLERPLSSMHWATPSMPRTKSETRQESEAKDENEGSEQNFPLETDEEIAMSAFTRNARSAFMDASLFEEAYESMEADNFRRTIPVKPVFRQATQGDVTAALVSNEVDQGTAFSCVLQFEQCYDIPINQVQDVMAVSNRNSLFIASQLLGDPSLRLNSKVKHVMGNIGRPRMTLLIPPIAPRITKAGIESWHMIDRKTWDGAPDDCFADSSLHLWFTGSTLPLDIGYTGAQDTELYFLESAVSLHGRGKWIADLDILKALRSWELLYSILTPNNPKNGRTTMECKHISNDARTDWQHNVKLLALQNWLELLDCDQDTGIFLAGGNWQARLAALSICVSLQRKLCVLGDDACWHCVAILVKQESPIIFIL
jgi:hypothetical protein